VAPAIQEVYYEPILERAFEAQAPGVPSRVERVEVPTAVAVLPKNIFRPPKEWIERAYDVRRFTKMARGGHFATLEEPELLVENIRVFFRPLR
jgi:pimeloyl-ACP methyl ester carboxylesterase